MSQENVPEPSSSPDSEDEKGLDDLVQDIPNRVVSGSGIGARAVTTLFNGLGSPDVGGRLDFTM